MSYCRVPGILLVTPGDNFPFVLPLITNGKGRVFFVVVCSFPHGFEIKVHIHILVYHLVLFSIRFLDPFIFEDFAFNFH